MFKDNANIRRLAASVIGAAVTGVVTLLISIVFNKPEKDPGVDTAAENVAHE